MTSYEMWVCDWHDQDWSAASATYEDEARERGWVVLHRREFRETVYPAIPGTQIKELRLSARWHDDYAHVCPECVGDPECRERFARWSPIENEDRWSAAMKG